MADADYHRWQREYWSSSAPDWADWAEAIGPEAEKINVPLLKAAGIKEGERVLDLACGAGEPAFTALKFVGETGRVTATDLAEEMLDVARDRAHEKGFSNIDFQQASMEQLPFDNDSFDHVVSRFGIMYAEDPARVFAEAARVLKPGGTAAFMVWGTKENNTLLSVPLETANERLNVLPEGYSDHPFIFSEPDSLAPLMRAAGFADAQEQDLKFEPEIEDGVPFWKPLVGMNCGVGMRDLDKEGVAQLDEAIVKALEPFRTDEGFKMSMHIRIVRGTAP